MVKLNIGLDHASMLGRTNFNEHFKELDEVLTRMETSDLQANVQKRKWTFQQVKYLGYIVTTKRHSPDPKQTQGLVGMKDPKSKRQSRRFLEASTSTTRCGGIESIHLNL